MLFDIVDYEKLGFIAGFDENELKLMKSPYDTNWFDPYVTFIYTGNAFYKANMEYYLSSLIVISIEDRDKFIKMYDDYTEALINFLPISNTYWHSLVSIPIKNLQPGQTFNIINDYTYILTGIQYLSEDNEKYPHPNPNMNYQVYVTETSIYSNSFIGYDLFTYTEYSKSLEQEYVTALKNVMALAKTLFESCDGRITEV